MNQVKLYTTEFAVEDALPPVRPHRVRRDAVKIHFFGTYNEAYAVVNYAHEIGASYDYDYNGEAHVLAVCGTLIQIAVIQGFIDGRKSR